MKIREYLIYWVSAFLSKKLGEGIYCLSTNPNIMNKIIVRFSLKSKSQNLGDAIKLTENCEQKTEDGFAFIYFNEPNITLQNLLKLVSSLKATKVFLNDKEIDARLFLNTFFCLNKLSCDGICTHRKMDWYNLNEIAEITDAIEIKNGTGLVYNDDIYLLGPFLEKLGSSVYKLNKEKLLDFVKNEWSLELENCEKINTDQIFSLIKGLPEKLDIIPGSSEDYDDFKDTEEYENYKEIAELFADAFEDRLRKVLLEFFPDKK